MAPPPPPAPKMKFRPKNPGASSDAPPPSTNSGAENKNSSKTGSERTSSETRAANALSEAQSMIKQQLPPPPSVTSQLRQRSMETDSNNAGGAQGGNGGGEERPTHSSRVSAPAAPMAPQPTTVVINNGPQFDRDDIEALRTENRILQTRLAAFLEFQSSTQASPDAPLPIKGMAEAELTALMTLMRTRIRQLELALSWECSRREEAEERCFALMKRAASTQ